jgi:hypothetical protein
MEFNNVACFRSDKPATAVRFRTDAAASAELVLECNSVFVDEVEESSMDVSYDLEEYFGEMGCPDTFTSVGNAFSIPGRLGRGCRRGIIDNGYCISQ